ncbi:hypothetical protein [Streptomyces lichenis]|uniref:Uncharacterized protein n=1 Tax=Streptomyces lichenis TaxID=2306967 RepID=A0ABT0ICU0_9ACTN|nr:hypothetical protein [Streptomyces lichenis]MCK8679138.1 hypothetical protein [Streptomyces lichenis]
MADPHVSGEVHHRACGVCPGRRHPVGEFDVFERPTAEAPFSPADGLRYLGDGTPVCVHPEKVGLPPGRYKSKGAPLVVQLDLPSDPSQVATHLHGVFHGTAPALLDDLIVQATDQIRRAFPELDALSVLRQALG